MNASVLKGIYLFADLSDVELQKVISISTEKNVLPGQDIFSVGQVASAFYVLTMGSVKLTVNTGEGDEIQIRNFGSGSHFGEMPFLDGQDRSATVQAIESSHLLEIPYDKLQTLLDKDPVMAAKFYRATSRFLALRLRATTGDLNQLKELKFQH